MPRSCLHDRGREACRVVSFRTRDLATFLFQSPNIHFANSTRPRLDQHGKEQCLLKTKAVTRPGTYFRHKHAVC